MNTLKTIDGFDPAEFREAIRIKERTKMINYLKKHGIKVDVSIEDGDLKNLYLHELTKDADFLSPDLIEAERDSRFGEVGNMFISLVKNVAKAFLIPDISDIVKEAGSTAIYAALKAGDIAISTSDDVGKDLSKRDYKNTVLENIDEEDSVFRIYSSFNNYLDKIPEFYQKEYPSFAKQFAMLGAMNLRPEDANLSRIYVKAFTEQLETIFNSGEYELLPLRYEKIKDEMWWLNEEYLNQSYKLSKEFVPGMMGLSTSFINDIPDINAISFLTKLMQSRNVDIDELQNMDEDVKTPGAENLKNSPMNSKKTKSSEKNPYESINKSLEFEMQGNFSQMLDLQSNSLPSSIGSLPEIISDYNNNFLDYNIEDYLKNSIDINIIPSENDKTTYLDKISMLSNEPATSENSTAGNMPFKLNYEISATDMTGGLIQEIGENYSDMSELVVDAVQNIQTFNEEGMSAVSGADELKQSMNEYKAETYSAEKAIDALNTAFLAMNISGINVPFTTTEESIPFSKSLYDAADACGMLASAFMNVDENIGIR